MKALVPEFTKVDPITVLTVTSIGDPNTCQKYISALYGTAYATKMKVYKPQNIVMHIGNLIARWPDAHLKPKDQWTGIWGLAIPEYVHEEDLIQKDPEIPVKIETWKYNDVAQILHLGPYSEEGPTIMMLHEYIAKNGFEIDGNSHEEVYLTMPNAKVPKTLIRYRIKKAAVNQTPVQAFEHVGSAK